MILALLVTLAVLFGGGSGVLAWAHVRRVTSAGGDAGALAIALKKLPSEARIAGLASMAKPGSWEHAMATEVLAAPSAEAKIAAVNDALFEVEHALRGGAAWAQAGIRIALFGCMLLAAGALVGGLGARWALTLAGVGVVSALACFEGDRSAKRAAVAKRLAIDGLVAAAVGHLPADTSAGARRGRWGRSGRR